MKAGLLKAVENAPSVIKARFHIGYEIPDLKCYARPVRREMKCDNTLRTGFNTDIQKGRDRNSICSITQPRQADTATRRVQQLAGGGSLTQLRQGRGIKNCGSWICLNHSEIELRSLQD